jgi:hypothetical protein
VAVVARIVDGIAIDSTSNHSSKRRIFIHTAFDRYYCYYSNTFGVTLKIPLVETTL